MVDDARKVKKFDGAAKNIEVNDIMSEKSSEKLNLCKNWVATMRFVQKICQF